MLEPALEWRTHDLEVDPAVDVMREARSSQPRCSSLRSATGEADGVASCAPARTGRTRSDAEAARLVLSTPRG